MNLGIGRLMVVSKNFRYLLNLTLVLLFVLALIPIPVRAQEGIDYCIERYGTDDINECVYILHQQGIMFVDPLGGGNGITGNCSSISTIDGALSLSFPVYSNEADIASKFEEFIRSKRPNSPWLTVPNLGTKIISQAKQFNANPFLMITIGKTESNFSTAGTASTVQNNPFGIKANGGGYVTFPTVEAGLFNENGILEGLQRRLSEHPNYKEVKSMYEYFSVHNTGQILYPGDNYYSGDPEMAGAVVSSEGDTGYGPVEYWRNAMNDYNEIFGTDLPTTPPQRDGTPASSSGTSCEGSYPPGTGGWDLPGEGPNPLAYFSQLYGCEETPPTSRSFAKTCDPAVGANAFGSGTYGSGSIEKCGCGPTSIAMISTTLTGNRITPQQVANWAEDNNGVDEDGCGSSWFWTDQGAQKEFGITVSSVSTPEFASTLSSGKLILVSLTAFPSTDSPVGHISVIRKVDEQGKFYFADPYSGGWGSESSDGASRMAFTESELAGMIKGSWAIGGL